MPAYTQKGQAIMGIGPHPYGTVSRRNAEPQAGTGPQTPAEQSKTMTAPRPHRQLPKQRRELDASRSSR